MKEATARSAVAGPPPELARRVAAGEIAALGELYDLTSDRAYGMCLRMLGDVTASEGVLETAYGTVWRTSASYDPAHGSVAAWVLAIVHREATEALLRGPSVAREPQPELATPDGFTAPEWATIQLAYFGGHRTDEVARLLGVSRRVAGDRILQVLRRVREVGACAYA